MPNYGSPEVLISLDDAGGTLRNISQNVTEFSGISISALTEETTTFSDTWVENSFVGMKELGEITISGFYNDTATTGINAVVNSSGTPGVGSQRTLTVCWNAATGTTNNYYVTTVECIIKAYNRTPEVGGLTKFELVLLPASSLTDTITATGTTG